MYDSGLVTEPPTGGIDMFLVIGIGAGALIVGVIVTYLFMKKK
jgi:hypothetical protein